MKLRSSTDAAGLRRMGTRAIRDTFVIGDLFQNYATKYVGISRAIPLSNTNQLWGLLWAIFVFGELRGLTGNVYVQVIGGSLLMGAGAIAIAFRIVKI